MYQYMSKELLELFSEQSNWGYGYFSGGSLQFQFGSLYSSKNPERKRITISTKKYSAAQPIWTLIIIIKNIYWALYQHIEMIYKSLVTYNDDWKFSFAIIGIVYILKYIT